MSKEKIYIFFDTCAFWPPQPDEKKAVCRLKELETQRFINIEMPHSVEEELMRAPCKIPQETVGRIFTIPVGLNMEEQNIKNRIRKILFPKKSELTKSDQNDITHIFEAQKYGCDFFVTVDKRHILSKAEILESQIGVQVLSPTKCLKIVLEKINLA